MECKNITILRSFAIKNGVKNADKLAEKDILLLLKDQGIECNRVKESRKRAENTKKYVDIWECERLQKNGWIVKEIIKSDPDDYKAPLKYYLENPNE